MAAPLPVVWHITPDGVPATAGDEGFIHASFPAQLGATLKIHFKDAAQVVLLRLDADGLGDTLIVEPSRGGQDFPHIYGVIGDGHVLERLPITRGEDGAFDLSAVAGAVE